MTEQELMYASDEDIAFFHKCIEGLPVSEVYSCGAHSVKALRMIIEMSSPKSIFEIGTNVCRSASMWLELSKSKITTIDISQRPETIEAVTIMREKYGSRFSYINRNNTDAMAIVRRTMFDLAFIDGGHLYEDVIADIGLVLSMNIPWIAFDDVIEKYGPGVIPAIKQFPQLYHIKTIGNIALYKNTLA